ncbi:MAG: discoidin domain-containing protein, partial [Bacteroidota bacterium]
MKNILNIVVLTMLVYSTIQAQTQCFDPDPGIWKDTWTSCQKTDNPNSVYPKSHWIQYDFGVTRKLSNSWVWNANDPNNLNVGFNVVNVDYSMDGVNWTYWGEMTFPKAKGEAVYSGFQGPKFEGIEARYVLLTAMTNHGDPTCAGLAEVKFNLLPNYELSNFEGEEEEEEEEEYCLFVTDVVIDEVTATTASIYWDYEFYGEEEPFFFFQIRGGDDEEGYEIELEESYVFLDDLAEDTR